MIRIFDSKISFLGLGLENEPNDAVNDHSW